MGNLQNKAVSQSSNTLSNSTNNSKNGVAKRHNPQALRLSECNRTVRILLYGTGEAGKTTLLRQVARIFNFQLNERPEDIKPTIIDNIIRGAHIVLEAANKLNIYFANANALQEAQAVETHYKAHIRNATMENVKSTMDLNPSLARSIFDLLVDPNFKMALKRRAEYQLEDTWEYFARKLSGYPAWGGNGWLPTDEEILHARLRTTGANPNEVQFSLEGQNFRVYDVGGQGSERNKFLGRIAGVDCIIHMVAISEYNQTLFENDTKNRLTDAVEHWAETINNRIFKDTLFILFFNKMDLFVQKYYNEKVPIILSGIDFVAPPTWQSEADNECSNALKWFYELFKSRVKASKLPDFYVEPLTALDRMKTEAAILRGMNNVLTILQAKELL